MNEIKSKSHKHSSSKRSIFSAILFLIVFLLLKFFFPHNGVKDSVYQDSPSFWAQKDSWFLDTLSNCSDEIDVFYLISTEVITAKDSLGHILWRSTLSQEDRKAMEAEMSYVRNKMFYDDFNFFSPYYHQFTFDAIQAPSDTLEKVYQNVSTEICEAFDYYMRYWNNGRRFVLAGFSQGAMLLLDLLRHMSDEQFSRMVAAYEIGYRLSEDDLRHPHIQPAVCDTDCQVVISYNSVLSREGIWPLVSKDATTCINPVNWKTDATPASFTYEGMQGIVSVDTVLHTLMVDIAPEKFHEWLDNPVCKSVGMGQDCLHHWDLLFYPNYIHDNALKRARGLNDNISFATP